MFCTECGNKLPEGVKFCPGCGAKLQIGEADRRLFLNCR